MLQTLITALIGVSALAYLLKRWWPAWQGLWRAAPTPPCATEGDATVVGSPKPGCGQGCGQCGQGQATPAKDHRIHLVRQAPH